MKNILILAALCAHFMANAQDTIKKLTFSGYVETFYAFDFNHPLDNRRPAFLYNHNRHNEFNVNLAFIKAAFADSKVRANVALATGTYMLDNYANESSVLKNILEANAGIRLSQNTWLDVGIMPSHIGFESAVSKDCWTLTRSLLAENSPYFETGAKLTFSPNEKWAVAFLVLNGWQRIARINSTPSVGSQIFWKPSDKLNLNWSTFYGNDRPDSLKQMRFFNNFYGTFQITEHLGVIAGFDIGMEQTNKGSKIYQKWLSPVVIARLTLSDKWALAGRFENYTDRNGIIITPNFQTFGYSLNIDYAPLSHASLRAELRYLDSKNTIFSAKNGIKNQTLYLTTSLAVGF